MTSDEKINNCDKHSQELLDLLNDVDELDWLEAKSLRDDTSRSILETVCSFSNEPGLGGGVILIGAAESSRKYHSSSRKYHSSGRKYYTSAKRS